MSLTGTVERDMVRLPQGFHLPDGTRVQIVLEQGTLPAFSADDPLFRLGEKPVDDPLTDGARNHDAHSVLDIPPTHLGRMLPLSGEDDSLGELLESRR